MTTRKKLITLLGERYPVPHVEPTSDDARGASPACEDIVDTSVRQWGLRRLVPEGGVSQTTSESRLPSASASECHLAKTRSSGEESSCHTGWIIELFLPPSRMTPYMVDVSTCPAFGRRRFTSPSRQAVSRSHDGVEKGRGRPFVHR